MSYSRVKTFTNGGSCLPSDLNSIQDYLGGLADTNAASIATNAADIGDLYSTYYAVNSERVGRLGSAATAATYVLLQGGGQLAAVPVNVEAAAFYLDPADYSPGTRTTKYRLKGSVATNAVAPAITFTFGLYSVATWGGASAAEPTVATLNAVTASSTVAVTTPGATTESQGSSSDFALSAGWFVLACATSGTLATGARVALRAALQRHAV